MKVKIDKLSNNTNTFETKLPLEGILAAEPVEGRGVLVIGGEYGGLATSMVQEITKTDTGWVFKTLNSEYEITILENEDAH